MADVPMPRDLSEEAVAEWILRVYGDHAGLSPGDLVSVPATAIASAVRALVEQKVREAVVEMKREPNPWIVSVDGIVARVM